MIERLQNIENRYNELNNELMKPEVISDIKKTLELTREQASLKDAYEIYQVYKKLLSDIDDATLMVKDPELDEFAREELEKYNEEKVELESKIEIMLLPKDPNDGKNVIVEIRGAAGGDEGNIFAGDLYEMYRKLAEKEGWKIEVLDEELAAKCFGKRRYTVFLVKGYHFVLVPVVELAYQEVLWLNAVGASGGQCAEVLCH